MLQRKEITSLLINVICTKMLLTFPRTMIINSGNSAWIQALYNAIVVFIIFFITTSFYRGKKNVIELAQMAGGKALKIIVGLMVFAVLMINFVIIMRIFPETVKIVLLQDFRIEVILIAFIIAISIGAYIGIEAISKINYIFMPIAGAVFIVFLLLLLPYYKFDNIFPIFGEGYKKLFVNGFNGISLFSDLILLNVFLSHCENNGEAKKSGRRALLTSTVISVIILLAYCLVYPYPASKDFMLPVYQLAKVVHVTSFFSRFEALFQFIWSILVLLYSAIYVYALCYVWQTTFGLKHYRPLIFPIVVINGVIALIPSSIVTVVATERLENIVVYPIAFLLPIIFGIVSRKYYGKLKNIEKEQESEDI